LWYIGNLELTVHDLQDKLVEVELIAVLSNFQLLPSSLISKFPGKLLSLNYGRELKPPIKRDGRFGTALASKGQALVNSDNIY